MAKERAMGKEYWFNAKGEWQYVSEMSRTAKKLIEDSNGQGGFFGIDYLKVYNLLQAYLVPQEKERFDDFHRRFFQAFYGKGLHGELASFIGGKNVPYVYRLKLDYGQSSFIADSKLRERQYGLTIDASGLYSKVAEDLAESLVKHMGTQVHLKRIYNSLDKLI
jgi:hypothetical protein